MYVSNTTGKDIDYQVSGQGADRVVGRIPADDYTVVRPRGGGGWSVEFFAQGDGRLLAGTVVNDPKASVVLVEADGTYSAVSSVAPIDAFISYPHVHREWAEKLDATLRVHGVSTWLDTALERGASWREEIERAIDQARTIIVLTGPEEAGQQQRAEWRLALEEVWRDPTKRLVPVLVGGAQLPNFVRSARSPGRVVAAIQLDPQSDWSQDLAGLIAVVKNEADLRQEGKVVATAEDDRRRQQEWLSYLRKVAADADF